MTPNPHRGGGGVETEGLVLILNRWCVLSTARARTACLCLSLSLWRTTGALSRALLVLFGELLWLCLMRGISGPNGPGFLPLSLCA